MSGRRRKDSREKDLTSRFESGDFDEDRIEQQERFSERSRESQQSKILRTALLRAEEQASVVDPEVLPIGQVTQVYSLYSQVEHEGRTYLCVVRKTLSKLSETAIVVGDLVRFRDVEATDESGQPEAVIEQVLPRRTVLTRTNSFNTREMHPIVANADQMLIVTSLRQPVVKWGLVDRMLIAAQSGGLRPIICLNKVDLAMADKRASVDMQDAKAALDHYETLGATTLQTSVEQMIGLDRLRELLKDQTTVLAGHSGVGKSSLINSIQPHLHIRIGEVSRYTDKGRHTTTSAQRYPLDFGGYVVDTPGVKLFGLWGVRRGNLEGFFPDMGSGTAPQWRQESYQRIAESLPAER